MNPSDPFAVEGLAEIIAHRGYSARAPENTLAALRMAAEAGADAVEFDLHSAADGTPYLLHDPTLQRTTSGHGSISGYTAESLAGLDAGGWFDPSFEGEPIPTLEEALAGPARAVARIYAEVKDGGRPGDLDRIAGAVQDAGLADRTVFISMDWGALDRIRHNDPTSLVGYIVDKPRRSGEAFTRCDGDPRALLDFDATILLSEPALAWRAADEGIPLAVWTVNTVARAEAVYGLGVRRITTNEVDDLLAWRDALVDGPSTSLQTPDSA